MPEDKDRDVEQEQAEGTPQAGARLPIKKYGIYAGIVVFMIVAAYLVTQKVVKPMFAGGDAVTETAGGDQRGSDDAAQKHKSKSGHGSSDKNATSDIHLIDNIIVNPAGTGGRRFLSASIGFELSDPEASATFEAREAVVRDALITILSSQSIPELSDFKQREKLRQLIQLRVEKLLETDEIAAVYFAEFVLQ